MYKCRICGKQYDNLEEVINCEKNCFIKLKEEENKEQTEKKIDAIKNTIQMLTNDQDEIIANIKYIDEDIEDLYLEIKEYNDEKKAFEDKLKSITKEINKYTIELNNIENKEENKEQKELKNNNIDNKEISNNFSAECFINGEKVPLSDFINKINDINSIFKKYDNDLFNIDFDV